MPLTNTIGHEDAKRLISFIADELAETGAGAAAAVVDPHGELVAFLRTDGCPLPSINNAIHKAFTAAREGVESGAIGQRSVEEGFSITNFGDLRYTGWGGGVPIIVDGETIGAVGVSGLPDEVDVAIARRAAALVAT